ncbi:MAG: YibE/F family protein [Spirochaetales bacterium]|nr:YibE/F family protein [Spirochaetales bacterium]
MNAQYLLGALKNSFRDKRRDLLFTILVGLVTAVLLIIPNGFGSEAAGQENAERVRGKIVSVDNSMIKITGPVKSGEQLLEVQILSGQFKGNIYESANNLVGKMEIDKFFAPGDEVLTILNLTEDKSEVVWATVFEHYRTDKTYFLASLFFFFLIVISGWTGFKAVVSFVFSGVLIIRVLLPATLRGIDPIPASIVTLFILTAVITLLIGGLSRKGFTAFTGAMGGVILTSILAWFFTYWFKIHGAVRPFAETLLYNGNPNLNLVHLFIAGVFIASSGAVMDLAMDIAAAMAEVLEKHPAITRLALIGSGFTVARHVTGTMTTTLLLAYSAQYTAMLMAFISMGVPFSNIINMVFVSSEVLHTLVGSFGLILVAPLTAITGGILLIPAKKTKGL